MKTNYLVLFILLFFTLNVSAQNRNSIWCFGDSAGIDFRNLNNPIPIATGMDGRGGCTSIADSSGNLQFYAYSFVTLALTKIINANHDLMTNSNLITGWGGYSDNVIIPKPGSNHEYYDFYIGPSGFVDTTYFCLIDMNLNGGLGDVVKKNVPIGAYRGADCLTAVKHGNGRDWWIVGKLSANPPTTINRFYVYLITPDSIFPAIVQDFGGARDVDFQKVVWHPLYEKLMVINTRGYMAEFDFDRCTGIVALNRVIFPEQPSNFDRPFWEGAYSPSGNIFYTSRTSYGGNYGDYNYLLQFDLNAIDIAASCDTLDSTRYLPVDCGAVRLAPDGKIYYSQAYIPSNALGFPYADSMRNSINENLGVINFPDSLGAACNFQPFSFYLGGKRTYYGLPNNPDYDLGPVIGSVCDSLFNDVSEAVVEKNVLRFYPNPASNEVTIVSNRSFMQCKLRLLNSLGEVVMTIHLPDQMNQFTFSMSDLEPGIYTLETTSNDAILKTEKLIIVR